MYYELDFTINPTSSCLSSYWKKIDSVWIIGSSYKYFAFLVHRTWNGMYDQLWEFLDEYNVEIFVDFQQYISEEFVFSNILRKYS